MSKLFTADICPSLYEENHSKQIAVVERTEEFLCVINYEPTTTLPKQIKHGYKLDQRP
jgi:hypothetical protein